MRWSVDSMVYFYHSGIQNEDEVQMNFLCSLNMQSHLLFSLGTPDGKSVRLPYNSSVLPAVIARRFP